MKFLIVAVCFITLGTSCNSEYGSNNGNDVIPVTTLFPDSTKNPQRTTAQSNTQEIQASTSNATVALNPAHGQPGHRCDIAVGAPLNTPATNSTTATNNTSVSTNTNATVTPVSKTTATGLNPKHGEPGHRCDIAVGAPLNTPATNNTTQTTNTTNATTVSNVPTVTPNTSTGPPKIPTVNPFETNTNNSKTVTDPKDTITAASGLNPKHGKPGHRCDIAVGEPLNSKPKQ